MIECSFFCYLYANGKFWFILEEDTVGRYKVPMVLMDEATENPNEFLITGISKLGLYATCNELGVFDKNSVRKRISIFMKANIFSEIGKGLKICTIEDLFENVCQEQEIGFLKLLSKMQTCGEFKKTELSLFKKIAGICKISKDPG